MSKSRSRNSLLSSHSKVSHNHADQNELASMKYRLEEPGDSIYPLDSKTKEETESIKHKRGHDLTYPDFQPWKDHTNLDDEGSKREVEKMQNTLFLNKGLFEAPQVSNEYYSARNLIQAAVFSSSENCSGVLKELSQHLASFYKTRNEIINKIQCESNNFKLPPRVTLTSLKREAWLKDLANPTVPLHQVSLRLPHGIKNKILVDALCSKLVPITRALWFTKCVLYGDSVAIRKKVHLKVTQVPFQGDESALLESQEVQWLQEWTQQVVDYLYRFSRDISNTSSVEKKHDTTVKMNYLLKYIQAVYIECLIDKDLFLSSILKFLKEGLLLDTHSVVQLLLNDKSDLSDETYEASMKDLDLNYGQRLVALLAIKIFWLDIIKLDYICKELCELLLLNYYFILKAPVFNPKHTKPCNMDNVLSYKLKEKMLKQISEIIKYLFKSNTNAFIMPNYWILIGNVLYQILLEDSSSLTNEETKEIQRQLQLVLYRNESLMLNMKHSKSQKEIYGDGNSGINNNSHRRTSSFPSGFGSVAGANFQFDSLMLSPEQNTNLDTIESDLFINRSYDDIFRIIDYLDKLKFNEDLAKLLRPSVSKLKNSSSVQTDWKLNLAVVLMWCVTNYRDAGVSRETILMACGFIKHRVLQANNGKTLAKVKASMESAILDILYNYSEKKDHLCINFENLYVLINELYQLKIVTVSAYLRKLIASGIFYLEPGEEPKLDTANVVIQIEILKNLPVLNNKQCDNILRKWSGDKLLAYVESFEAGKKTATEQVIDKISNNCLVNCDFSGFKDLKTGITYLLVNWMTDEVKSLINKSSKLIHIKISTISSLYELYCLCDNLTVFFKVIIKSILKNEGKVVILDLDALYLISLLMVRHFKLIKTISGSDSSSVGYEIFRLIIINYKDLTLREFDYFNFKGIWNFIDHSVERKSSNFDDGKTPNSNNPKIQKPSSIPQFIYSKATVESPMKLNTDDKQALKDGEDEQFLSFDDFGNDLNTLLNSHYVFMSNEEVNGAVAQLKINNSISDTYSGDNGSKRLLIVLFDYYMKHEDNLSNDDENTLIKLMINTRNSIQLDSSYSVIECVSYFIQKQYEKFDAIDHNPVSNDQNTSAVKKQRLLAVLKKLVSAEVIDFDQLVNVFNSITDVNGSENNLNDMRYDLIVGNKDIEERSLDKNQLLLLELNRFFYCNKHESSVFNIIANEKKYKMDTTEFNSSDRAWMLLRKWLYSRSRFLMEGITNHFSNDQIILLVNKVSEFEVNIETSQDLLAAVPKINEFNITLFQILFKLILVREFDAIHELEEKHHKLKLIIELILLKSNLSFSVDNSFFGELFNLLPWNFKTEVLTILEFILFENSKFLSDESELVTVSCQLQGYDTSLNVLPILSDYFKKFTVSSIDSIETSNDFFQRVSDYLNQLLDIVQVIDVGGRTFKKNYDYNAINMSLSIFIRILIIHKDSITKLIISNEAQGYNFVRGLSNLLRSEYLSNGNEKLHILLYDLLLIFRDLLMKELNLSLSEDQQIPDASSHNNSNNNNTDGSGNITIGDSLINDNYRVPKYENFAPLFNLPEIESHNILKQYIVDDNRIKSAITLNEDELTKGGDYQNLNQSRFVLVKSRRDSVFLTNSGPFNILKKHEMVPPPEFKMKSFEIIDNTEDNVNDGRINLLLFDAYTTKQNPP